MPPVQLLACRLRGVAGSHYAPTNKAKTKTQNMSIDTQIKITRLCETLLLSFVRDNDLAYVYTSQGITLMSVDEAISTVEELKEATLALLDDQAKIIERDCQIIARTRREGNE